ncbi:hypothetical protein FIBSPDRAFT_870221 [Athelia psychrophila]|uniref:Uncharacterized protein n=1 Tax=Athelia psychrophila TaxID=1759441 RepID=A0A166BA94_9AGAM|nr:hypothetical protein FIBSPDRAFT_870221 [Fibularhizoctonia sp. CBS 109695]
MLATNFPVYLSRSTLSGLSYVDDTRKANSEMLLAVWSGLTGLLSHAFFWLRCNTKALALNYTTQRNSVNTRHRMQAIPTIARWERS